MQLMRGEQEFTATATVFEGEDSAAGAWRFSEDYQFHDVKELLSLGTKLDADLKAVSAVRTFTWGLLQSAICCAVTPPASVPSAFAALARVTEVQQHHT